MGINELNLQIVSPAKIVKQDHDLKHAYVESGIASHPAMDILRQFEANMATLEDLSGRLRFMMTEVRGLIAKKEF